MKIIIPSKKFKKGLSKLNQKMIIAFKERLVIFHENEFNPLLNNHKLKGKYVDCRSINITSDIRLIYEKTHENSYHFLTIGTHSKLYS